MAPLIRATIQFLLGHAHIEIPFQSSVKDPPARHNANTPVAIQSTNLGPSLSTISWGFNRMDVFGNDLDAGQVGHKYWDGYQWQPSGELELIGGFPSSPPAAVSWNTSRMDIFSVNAEDELQHKFFDGSAWQPAEDQWESLTSNAALDTEWAPAATSWAPNRLDVFCKGTDEQLYHTYFDGSGWYSKDTGMESLGGELISGLAAVSWGSGRNDIFGVDYTNAIAHIYWDGSKWSEWEQIAAESSFWFAPTAISWGPNRLDVFAVNNDGNLSHVYWDGSQWSAEENLGGGNLIGSVSATSWNVSRLDIVALGNDDQYYYKYFDGGDWQPSLSDWYLKGGNFSSVPSLLSWGDNRLDIYGITTDKNLAHQTWWGQGWYPGSNEWETLGRPLSSYGH